MAEVIDARLKDLDGFSVSRILPTRRRKMVGPFIFVDHMGPAEFSPGHGIDVRPHPHIGLATLTYMIEGSLLHRDSLGNNLEIIPGDVNWMTAGRGIVHSERETIEVKARPHVLNGMQCWMALPERMADIEPSFTHIKRAQLPHHMLSGVMTRLIAGEAFGMTSPIKTYSDMFFCDVLAQANQVVVRPNPDQECLLYVLSGSVRIGEDAYRSGAAVVLEQEMELRALENARFLLLGGARWQKQPFIEWNFVSFSQERIEQAKRDWQEQRFPKVPGDSCEFTPLPESSNPAPAVRTT